MAARASGNGMPLPACGAVSWGQRRELGLCGTALPVLHTPVILRLDASLHHRASWVNEPQRCQETTVSTTATLHLRRD